MLAAATPKAAQTLIAALDAEYAVVVGGGDSARMEMVPDYELRVKAANAVLDRVYGRPTTVVAGEDGPVIVSVDLAAMLERIAR